MRAIFNRCTDDVNGMAPPIHTKNWEVRGRSDKAQVAKDLEANMYKMLPEPEAMMEYGSIYGLPYETMCFYGEGFGPGIQKGGKYGDKKDFVVFDIKVGNSWLSFDQVVTIGCDLGIPVVPTVSCGTLAEHIGMVESGLISTYGNFIAEGLVVHPMIPFNNRWGERIRAKIKGVDYV
jgi:hypothetical protein